MLINMKRGFTVVEVIVTMVVITVILSLGTVGLRASLANGRDAERQADIAAIAQGLEERYNNGNALEALPGPPYWYDKKGRKSYPGVNEFIHMQGSQRSGFTPETVSNGYFTDNLPGTSLSSLTTPSGNRIGQVCVYACQPAGNEAQLQSAYNGAQGIDRYIYEAIDRNGNICSNGTCVAYNLYWVKETDPTTTKGIPGLQIVKSKHQ